MRTLLISKCIRMALFATVVNCDLCATPRTILVLVYLLPHLLPFPVAADFRKQIILLHNSQYSFWIAENLLTFQPKPHPTVSVGTEAAFPLLCDEFGKSCILFWSAKAMDKGIVAASGYSKKFAHDCHRALCSVTIYDMVFYRCPHLLPAKWRKSRSSLFSIRSR